MNKLLNVILRTSIAASLSDREAFTEKVSKIVEDKTGSDPEAAKKLSNNLATAMDSISDQLLIEQLFNPTTSEDTSELETKIDKLTASIEKLNTNIEKLITNGTK